MSEKHLQTTYESPLVLVGAFRAEQGFAQSFGETGKAGKIVETDQYVDEF